MAGGRRWISSMNSTSRGCEVRQDAGEVARLLDAPARRGADRHAHLVGDHVGERRLAEARAGRRAARGRAPRRAACAAAIDTCRFSRTRSWPMYSSSVARPQPGFVLRVVVDARRRRRRSRIGHRCQSLARARAPGAPASKRDARSSTSGGVLTARVSTRFFERAADDSPRFTERREQIVAQRTARRHRLASPLPATATPALAAADPSARATIRSASSCRRRESRQPRDVAALMALHQLAAARCPTAPPAPASDRCR